MDVAEAVKKFLLTPLREGRHDELNPLERAAVISTHAPAGGATKGALRPRGGLGEDFYSRPCGRGDARYTTMIMAQNPISTHAPAGGATTG